DRASSFRLPPHSAVKRALVTYATAFRCKAVRVIWRDRLPSCGRDPPTTRRPLTRRFDIGPVLVAIGAIGLLVGLFLRWDGDLNGWDAFDLADVLLAALAVGALVAAVGLLVPDAELLDRRALPWLAGAALVVTAAELVNPPPSAAGQTLGLGAWMSFVATLVM